MRLSIDVGGTFTDILLTSSGGRAEAFKASTTYPDPIEGIVAGLELAAASRGFSVEKLLGETGSLFHSTTRAINAVVTGNVARTALLVTQGHPDILLIREGGRTDPFNYKVSYPPGYISRALTFEIPERVCADGRIHKAFDEAAALRVIERLKAEKIEAVAVSFLWSIVNAAHELQMAALLDRHLPAVPYTLGHRINPTVREYRRTSSCGIDASLKPVMSHYLRSLRENLVARGLRGQIHAVTSQGGLIELSELADRPILALNSGPSMAPVAGRHFAKLENAHTAIVTDAGGTTFDVSLVRAGVIPWTRDTWLGPVYQGHFTGFPSVDVKSVGAGGGSIASVDAMGLLRVGPESAGSTPGPVCYGRGGEQPTMTDAAVVLGYIDPNFFLGGNMGLVADAARRAIADKVAGPLGVSIEEAALSILDLTTESMVNAIEDITVKQGIDPADTVIIGGGGAAGINAVSIARRLRCGTVIFPGVGAVLSAAGAVLSEMSTEFSRASFMTSSSFDSDKANAILADLAAQCQTFFDKAGRAPGECRIDFSMEGRYPSQVWELEVPLRAGKFTARADVGDLVADFHQRHTELFSFRDDGDEVEIMSWRAVARCPGPGGESITLVEPAGTPVAPVMRSMFFRETGQVEAPTYHLERLPESLVVTGPALVVSNFTTVVVNPGARAQKRPEGHLVVQCGA